MFNGLGRERSCRPEAAPRVEGIHSASEDGHAQENHLRGQTGADRAALDAASEAGIPHGGWIPKGRLTEAGPLPERYQLKEMLTGSYEARTEKNVVDSDGTLIFSHGPLNGGSALTRSLAKKHGKPWIHLDLDQMTAAQAAQGVMFWVRGKGIRVLNVAGPRVSGCGL
ncbi:MAG: putative molybdenum carrier protein [Acidobacteriota bacterium]